MAGTNTLRAELQEQRRIIEEQRVELKRQRGQLDVQFNRTADVQAQVDLIKATLQKAASILQPSLGSPGHRNGNGHRAASRPKRIHSVSQS